MTEGLEAQIISDGDSQIVRLPSRFRLATGTVIIRRDDRTGDLILTPNPPQKDTPDTWAAFFDHLNHSEPDPDFLQIMQERPLNRLPVDRKIFGDE